MYRQGDVLLVPVAPSEVPSAALATPVDRRGRFVLARGEATGHAHVVAGPGLRVLADPVDADLLFVDVPTKGVLTHDEHGSIHLPSGHYRVIRQREYIPGSYRPIAD